MSQATASPNRLIHESSLYLKQHANNPVDWYPWGPEALARAKELDRPIFLSIGYSACHWCHVMEHESFEDPETARVLNDHFVSIKVDREERPDLDQIYMSFVQAFTGHGGWPMSVFLMPDGKPFFGGTYFPPDDRYGERMPSFRRLLGSLIDAWQNRRSDVLTSAEQITTHLQGDNQLPAGQGELGPQLLRNTINWLRRAFDSRHGGFGSAPKFPHPTELRLLLRIHQRFDDDEALSMARLTLDRMAQGGIYDHLGGGFHRYSTDAHWLVPHFEKMLYDNSQLASAYVEAFQVTGDPFYRRVVEETLAYVRREMTSPEGPFYSTQDADSEGVEGKFFVWSAAEIESILGKEEADVFSYVYDVTGEGNWEGHNILHRTKTDMQAAKLLGLEESDLVRRLAESRKKLLDVRSRRVWPGRDEKILTSWNALMISAFAQAAQVLEIPAYATVAERAAAFLVERLRSGDGRLLRTCSLGKPPKLNAYLEDYAYLIDALVTVYETTFAPRWIEVALSLADVLVEQFWDAAQGGFYFTGKDHEALIARTKDTQDSSMPSGNAMAVTALLRLAKLTGRNDLRDKAEKTLQLHRGMMEVSPMATGQMLIALDFLLGPTPEYAVIGDPNADDTRRVWRAIRGKYRPNKVVAFKSPGQPDVAFLPLLHGKTYQQTVTTYVCQDFTCQAPVVGAEALEKST